MRRLWAVLALLVLVVSLAGCESQRGQSPFETSLPSAKFGLRVTDGQLRLWTGSACPGTTQVGVRFATSGGDDAELRINTPSDPDLDGLTPGVEFQYLSLSGPYPGFQVEKSIPSEYDWQSAEFIDFEVFGPPTARGIANLRFAPIVTEIVEHSEQHPEDTYYFDGVGWLNPTDVAARDGKDFLAVCTPDPARDEEITATVGVRVTDGTLRFWTGRTCPYDSGAILTFQPGQAEEILLKADGPYAEVEHITLGGTNPGLTVTRPLPAGFDWRTAESVLFRLADFSGPHAGIIWSRTTKLSTPIDESAQHPDDTYYFQGAGWLSPGDLEARIGTSMTTICD